MNLHEIMLAKQLAGKNGDNIPASESALSVNMISGEVSCAEFTSFDDYFTEE